MSLFDAQDLGDLLDEDVLEDTAKVVEQMVWGWLQPVLKLSTRPDPPSDQLFAWALELGAIAKENPTGLASYQLGAERWSYSAERRREILAEVAASVAVVESGGLAPGIPSGSFPAAATWPDPLLGRRW